MPPLHPQCHILHQALTINTWTIAKPLNGLLVSNLGLYPYIFHSAAGSFKNANYLHTHFTPLKAYQGFPVD